MEEIENVDCGSIRTINRWSLFLQQRTREVHTEGRSGYDDDLMWFEQEAWTGHKMFEAARSVIRLIS